jgi:hypothetical protein
LRYVAVINRFGFQGPWALRFYDEGKLIREYGYKALLMAPRNRFLLPYTQTDWHTAWYDVYDLDPSHRRLQLYTPERRLWFNLTEWWPYDRRINLGLQEFYTFDLATGTILTRQVVGAWRSWAFLAVFAATLFIIIFALLWTRRRIGRFRRWLRIRAGRCPSCGYDLRASPAQCPECGRPVDREAY